MSAIRGEPARVATLAGILFGLTGMGSAGVAVTVPVIAEYFGIPASTGAWILTTYAITLGVAAAVYGRAADAYGIRRALLVGVSLMALGAVLAALSTSFVMLLCARLIQGAGASSVPVLVVALISARFDGPLRGAGLARLTGTAVTVGASGPLLAGLLEAAFGWRVVMYLPALGPLLVLALWRSIPTERSSARIDLLGGLLVVITAAGAIMTIQSPASGLVLCLTGLALLLLGLPGLVARVRVHPTGFVPLAVLRARGLLWVMVSASVIPTCWFGLLVAIPGVLAVRGWAPIGIGLLMLPSALPGIVGPRIANWSLHRFGPQRAVGVAGGVAITSVLVAASGAAGHTVFLVIAMILVNLAFGMGQPALAASVSESVPLELRSGALGLASLIFFVGGGVGSAIAGLAGVTGSAASILLLASVPLLFASVYVLIGRRRPATDRKDSP
ncbi:MAG: major facilitator superfamily 1 [Mycobacterium sp.]|nr:major facilitator superfamily 1 [Mycobacterium sp.]